MRTLCREARCKRGTGGRDLVPGPARQGAVTQGTAGGVPGSWGALVGRDVWERPRGHLGPHPLSAGTQVAPPRSRVSERLRGRCHTQALPVDTSHTDMSRESPGFWAKRCVRLGLRVPGLSRGSRGDVHVCRAQLHMLSGARPGNELFVSPRRPLPPPLPRRVMEVWPAGSCRAVRQPPSPRSHGKLWREVAAGAGGGVLPPPAAVQPSPSCSLWRPSARRPAHLEPGLPLPPSSGLLAARSPALVSVNRLLTHLPGQRLSGRPVPAGARLSRSGFVTSLPHPVTGRTSSPPRGSLAVPPWGLALAALLQAAFPALPAGLSSVAGALPGPVLTPGPPPVPRQVHCTAGGSPHSCFFTWRQVGPSSLVLGPSPGTTLPSQIVTALPVWAPPTSYPPNT